MGRPSSAGGDDDDDDDAVADATNADQSRATIVRESGNRRAALQDQGRASSKQDSDLQVLAGVGGGKAAYQACVYDCLRQNFGDIPANAIPPVRIHEVFRGLYNCSTCVHSFILCSTGTHLRPTVTYSLGHLAHYPFLHRRPSEQSDGPISTERVVGPQSWGFWACSCGSMAKVGSQPS